MTTESSLQDRVKAVDTLDTELESTKEQGATTQYKLSAAEKSLKQQTKQLNKSEQQLFSSKPNTHVPHTHSCNGEQWQAAT